MAMVEAAPPAPPAPPETSGGLAALEARLRLDLACLGYPPKTWTPNRAAAGRSVHDVVIVGGGMCGMVVWLALAMAGVRNVRIIDRSPPGLEGPWLTYARMDTLRSPKHLTGPAFGIGALSFQAWHRASFGDAAWDELDKIPRTMWMDYLHWYRKVLEIPVENGVELVAVAPDAEVLRLTVAGPGDSSIFTRKLVYATGREGSGRPTIPHFVDQLPREFWAHSADPIDFARLRGQRVAVIGAGASAVENAAEALEAGAKDVRLLVRRTHLPTINKLMGIGSGGFVNGFAKLPDAWRWRFLQYAFKQQTPPPRGSMQRVAGHANGHFHFGLTISAIDVTGAALNITFQDGRSLAADYVILGTGFSIDPRAHSELGAAAQNILLWQDVYAPPAGEENAALGRFPYLGEDFSFRGKDCDRSPWLEHVHCFNYAATASLGKVSGDIPGVSDGAAWLARELSARLYREDIAAHWRHLQAYDTPELHGDEWVASDLPTKGQDG